MRLSTKDVQRLSNILKRTRKIKTKLKLSKRISEGVFDYFLMEQDCDVERKINMSALELVSKYEDLKYSPYKNLAKTRMMRTR